jgi:hypothetical protein
MPISWNEIRHRGIKVSAEWRKVVRDNQTRWNKFFDVSGIARRSHFHI